MMPAWHVPPNGASLDCSSTASTVSITHLCPSILLVPPRYSLELRVAPGCAAAAERLVAACCPAARRRATHWQAGADGVLEGGMPGTAGTAGTAGVAGAAGIAGAAGAAGGAGEGAAVAGDYMGGEGEEAAHLSFAIPQQQADLPALFAALEQGR